MKFKDQKKIKKHKGQQDKIIKDDLEEMKEILSPEDYDRIQASTTSFWAVMKTKNKK